MKEKEKNLESIYFSETVTKMCASAFHHYLHETKVIYSLYSHHVLNVSFD